MKMAQNIRSETLDAKERLRRWEANKHKYPNDTGWWRDFYLSPNHADTKDEAQELLRKAADEIAVEELEARKGAEERARRWEAINKSPEARGARQADQLRLLSGLLGHIGVVYLLLYFAVRLAGREGLPILDTLWVLGLFVTPACYVMAVIFSRKTVSLWEKAQR
jgi:hypothetical protein